VASSGISRRDAWRPDLQRLHSPREAGSRALLTTAVLTLELVLQTCSAPACPRRALAFGDYWLFRYSPRSRSCCWVSPRLKQPWCGKRRRHRYGDRAPRRSGVLQVSQRSRSHAPRRGWRGGASECHEANNHPCKEDQARDQECELHQAPGCPADSSFGPPPSESAGATHVDRRRTRRPGLQITIPSVAKPRGLSSGNRDREVSSFRSSSVETIARNPSHWWTRTRRRSLHARTGRPSSQSRHLRAACERQRSQRDRA
jgi:hypothetical protein